MYPATGSVGPTQSPANEERTMAIDRRCPAGECEFFSDNLKQRRKGRDCINTGERFCPVSRCAWRVNGWYTKYPPDAVRDGRPWCIDIWTKVLREYNVNDQATRFRPGSSDRSTNALSSTSHDLKMEKINHRHYHAQPSGPDPASEPSERDKLDEGNWPFGDMLKELAIEDKTITEKAKENESKEVYIKQDEGMENESRKDSLPSQILPRKRRINRTPAPKVFGSGAMSDSRSTQEHREIPTGGSRLNMEGNTCYTSLREEGVINTSGASIPRLQLATGETNAKYSPKKQPNNHYTSPTTGGTLVEADIQRVEEDNDLPHGTLTRNKSLSVNSTGAVNTSSFLLPICGYSKPSSKSSVLCKNQAESIDQMGKDRADDNDSPSEAPRRNSDQGIPDRSSNTRKFSSDGFGVGFDFLPSSRINTNHSSKKKDNAEDNMNSRA